MPICTVDRKRLGSAASSSAALAPADPDLAIAFNRASRDETIASSLIANTPLSAISARIRTMSNQGMGAKGPLMIEASPCRQSARRGKARRRSISIRNYRRRPPFPTAIPIQIRRISNASLSAPSPRSPCRARSSPPPPAPPIPYTGRRTISKTAIGAGVGLLGGYLAGDVVGGRSDRTAKIIGAGVGVLAGGAVGAYMDRQEAELRRQTAGTGVDVIRSGDDLILRMPSGITFPVDSYAIQPQFQRPSTRSRRRSAAITQTYVDVLGHTDSTGSDAYNQTLSVNRAQAVASYLELARRRLGATRRCAAMAKARRSPRTTPTMGRAAEPPRRNQGRPGDPAAQGY